jgi:hypothetical protein
MNIFNKVRELFGHRLKRFQKQTCAEWVKNNYPLRRYGQANDVAKV